LGGRRTACGPQQKASNYELQQKKKAIIPLGEERLGTGIKIKNSKIQNCRHKLR
jgi:hypothetical protein